MRKLAEAFGERDLSEITPEDILAFLVRDSDGQKQSTRCFKYTLLKAFFSFTCMNVDESLSNPCDTPVLRKTFQLAHGRQWTILEKDVVDEIIFRTSKARNRSILELMARGGMRIGDVLKLKAVDVDDRKLLLHNPKSGRQNEVVFIPKKIAERLKDYI